MLAHWTYGLGRSVAFTSDAARRWAKTWPDWPSYAAFWSQVTRWVMRPAEQGNLSLTVRRDEGRIKVVVDALDKDDQFLNFLQVQGSVVDPDLKSIPLELVQTAPGRYEATVENAEASGNYFVNLGYRGSGETHGVLSTGIAVPYSDEYRELRSNPSLMETIASVTDGSFTPWKTTNDNRIDLARTVESVDHFRRDESLVIPRSFAPLWPSLLWLAACLFLGDVAVRRIAPDTDRMKRSIENALKWLKGQQTEPEGDYMDKLRARKAEVAEQLERSRRPSRVENEPTPREPSKPIDEPLLEGRQPADRGSGERRPADASRPGIAPTEPKPEETSYTERLRRAKRQVWEDRDKDKEKDKPDPNSGS
jgi:hypothetical protein